MLENCRDVIYCLNLQTGHYEYISPSVEEVLGFSSADLLAMDVETALAMIHPGDQSALRTAITHLEETGKADLEYRQLTKAGEFRWLSNRMSLTRDDKGMPLYRLGNIRDITESKRTEKALGESCEKFRFIAANIPDTLFFQDKELRYEWIFNPSEPLRESDVVGKTDFDLLPFEEAERLTDIKRKVLETGTGLKTELQLSPGGLTRWYEATYEPSRDSEGKIVGLVSYSRDITGRKSAEDKLKKAAESVRRERDKAQQFLDIAGVMIVALDRDQKVTLINQKGCSILGYPEKDIVGKNWFDHFIHSEDKEKVKEVFDKAMSGDIELVESFVNPVVTRDGSLRIISWHNSVIRDDAGNITGALSSGEDITQSKLAGEELRASETLVSTIAENSTHGLVMMDQRGYCTYANRALLEMTGYTDWEIRERPLHELIHHHYPDGTIYPIEECPIDRALPENFDVRAHEDLFFRKNGTSFPVLCAASPIFKDGRPVSTVIEVRDITDQKISEEALQKSVNRYQQQLRLFDGIATSTPDFVYVFDLQGRFLYANRRLLEVWGMELPDVIGKTTRELGYEQWHHEMHMREIEQVKKTKLPIKGEVPFKAPRTGLFGVYEYIFTPVTGPDGNVELIAGTTRDVTDRKRAEEERERLISELEASVRELEGFTYTISHDLRAPVRHIAGFAELLKQALGQDLDEGKRTYITTISKSAERLGVMIDELLNFSRMGRTPMKKGVVDLNTIVLDAIGELKEQMFLRNIEWTIRDLPQISGDATMLHFVFSNLISNAVKFTRLREDASIEIGYREEEDRHIIFIRDNGVGFDMAHYDKLFGVFHRLHDQREFEGTGIGLANVQRIIHRHGGDVWAESKVNEGATFYFSLPKVNNI
jgi:PAS domain S-box-containing protein